MTFFSYNLNDKIWFILIFPSALHLDLNIDKCSLEVPKNFLCLPWKKTNAFLHTITIKDLRESSFLLINCKMFENSSGKYYLPYYFTLDKILFHWLP